MRLDGFSSARCGLKGVVATTTTAPTPKSKNTIISCHLGGRRFLLETFSRSPWPRYQEEDERDHQVWVAPEAHHRRLPQPRAQQADWAVRVGNEVH